MWIKQVFKAADLVFEVPPGHLFWETNMHKPLLIAIIFPFLRSYPWQLWSTPKMYSMGSELRKVIKTEEMDSRESSAQILDRMPQASGNAGECGAENDKLQVMVPPSLCLTRKTCMLAMGMKTGCKPDGNPNLVIPESMRKQGTVII